MKATETMPTSASFMGSCLQLQSGVLLCSAASRDCSQPRCCMYNTRAVGMWKAAPVMQRVIWKCLGNSPFFSFSIHLSVPQLSHSLWCVYFSPRSTPPWSAAQGAIPTSLLGLGPLYFIAELAVARIPYTPLQW